MKIIKKLFNPGISMFDKYTYFRLCWNRSMAHIGIFQELLGLFKDFLILIGVFKLALGFSLTVGFILSLAYVLTRIIIGHADVQKGLLSKEISLHNQYNPEIQRLLKK